MKQIRATKFSKKAQVHLPVLNTNYKVDRLLYDM